MPTYDDNNNNNNQKTHTSKRGFTLEMKVSSSCAGMWCYICEFFFFLNLWGHFDRAGARSTAQLYFLFRHMGEIRESVLCILYTLKVCFVSNATLTSYNILGYWKAKIGYKLWWTPTSCLSCLWCSSWATFIWETAPNRTMILFFSFLSIRRVFLMAYYEYKYTYWEYY